MQIDIILYQSQVDRQTANFYALFWFRIGKQYNYITLTMATLGYFQRLQWYSTVYFSRDDVCLQTIGTIDLPLGNFMGGAHSQSLKLQIWCAVVRDLFDSTTKEVGLEDTLGVGRASCLSVHLSSVNRQLPICQHAVPPTKL